MVEIENVVARGLKRMRQIMGGQAGTEDKPLSPRQLLRLRSQLQDCATALGGEVAARQRAARLAETYLGLGDRGRREFLCMIAREFGPDPQAVAKAHRAYHAAIGTPRQWDAEAGLRAALRSSRLRIMTHFNALPQGVKFLVDLRADLLRYLVQDEGLHPLDLELESQFVDWFDVGFLELQRITWQSPAALLEKLIEYEAVHTIHSWTDLRNRLDTDRRCYAFFHPRMPHEPLIFVEVALTNRLADSIQLLLDEDAPVFDTGRADTAIFYSISNTQRGLRGVSFGSFLLKRVIDDLTRDFPRLKSFATLSPLPTFWRWVERNPKELEAVMGEGLLASAGTPREFAHNPAALAAYLRRGEWHGEPHLRRVLRHPLTRLAARYLLGTGKGELPFDPVARFHLGNGARVERLNWLADTSAKGFAQSYGLMVNYLYDPNAIEENVEAYSAQGQIAASAAIRRAAKE
ncbi:MAG: malonyl-CoA decarboxylase [Candidatus Methylophosphatis roskildensis]